MSVTKLTGSVLPDWLVRTAARPLCPPSDALRVASPSDIETSLPSGPRLATSGWEIVRLACAVTSRSRPSEPVASTRTRWLAPAPDSTTFSGTRRRETIREDDCRSSAKAGPGPRHPKRLTARPRDPAMRLARRGRLSLADIMIVATVVFGTTEKKSYPRRHTKEPLSETDLLKRRA